MDSLRVILFLNELELICLHTCIAIVSTKLNGFNYCNLTLIFLYDINHVFTQSSGLKYYYLTLIIQFNTIHLHTFKWFQVLLCITNHSIKHQSFVYTQFYSQTVLFLTIQFNISHLFAHSLK